MPTPPTPKDQKPRIWTVILFILALFTVVHIFSGIILGIYVALTTSQGTFTERMVESLETFGGLFVAIIAAQGILLLLVLPAAWLSHESFKQRLGLIAGEYQPWHVLFYMAATPAVGMVGYAYVMAIFGDVGASLEALKRILMDMPLSTYLALLLAITLLPAFIEEFVFRGYIQRRLTQRWGALIAITISSILFALFHVDIHHILMVFPLGIWLGILAWRTGSIMPAIACHAYNNMLATLLSRVSDHSIFETYFSPGNVVLITISFTALLVSLVLLWKTMIPTTTVAAYDNC